MTTSSSARLLPIAAAVNGTAVLVTVVLIVMLGPLVAVPAASDMAVRVGLAARLSVWPAVVVFVAVLLVIAARGQARLLNPIDDAETRFYRVAQRALANTVEQTLIFLPALWALAVLLPAEALGRPALFTGLFVAGRAAFVAGYLVHPYARAPGMAMTWTVNAVALGWAVWLAATASPSA